MSKAYNRVSLRFRGQVLLIALLVVLAIGVKLAYQLIEYLMPPLPAYPSAQEVSQIVSTKGAYVCDGGGARSDSHVRVTSFVTPDPPEVVKQFYYSKLVEQGLYTQSSGGDAYFTTFYAVDREAPLLGSGSAVILFTSSGYNRTVVKVREYRYQYHTSCHPGVRYDDPWDI